MAGTTASRAVRIGLSVTRPVRSRGTGPGGAGGVALGRLYIEGLDLPGRAVARDAKQSDGLTRIGAKFASREFVVVGRRAAPPISAARVIRLISSDATSVTSPTFNPIASARRLTIGRPETVAIRPVISAKTTIPMTPTGTAHTN